MTNGSILSEMTILANIAFCAAQVYIHCNLIAWDPEGLSEDKKACNYMKETQR